MREACRMKRDPFLFLLPPVKTLQKGQVSDHGFRLPSFTRLLPHLQEPTLHHCDSDNLPSGWP
jgi:hypothetical protein